MSIASKFLVGFIALVCIVPHAEAKQMRSKHQRQNSSIDLNIFGFGNTPPQCEKYRRQAIEIDTPDPRYWNAYYDCIGF
jgi:hypothetical protein